MTVVDQSGVSSETLASISTPDKVKSRLGMLEFTDGAPTPATAALLYDHLDFVHGVDAFDRSFPGASLAAMHAGVRSIGVPFAASFASRPRRQHLDASGRGCSSAEHVARGNEELVQQDLAVIQRSVGNIADDTNETQSAIWDGVRQGLDDCTQ